jgi:enoyl-CoA hydratase/carnithine racemase
MRASQIVQDGGTRAHRLRGRMRHAPGSAATIVAGGKDNMGTLVDYATDKGVAILTLTDPPANTYSHEMFKELDANILEARFDDDVHVVVLTGHGDKYFCAGADVNMLREADETFKYYFFLHASETLSRLEATPKLVIAAINGHAVRGGFEIALACDLRIARAGALQIGLPELALGVLPGTGGTQRLTRIVGKANAMELIVEGQTLPVEEAHAEGLVHKVWDDASHEEFMRQILEYAHEFCAPSRASMAVGMVKRAIQSGGEMSLDQGLALERELQQQLFRSQDAKEGLIAFVQKRKPVFRGK